MNTAPDLSLYSAGFTLAGMAQQLITVVEAAGRLGVTPQRVRVLIKQRRLPAVKYASLWLIKPEDLALVEERPTGRPRLKHE